jgi:hypothetical protein
MSEEEKLANAVKWNWGDNAVEYLCGVISTLVTPEQMTVLIRQNREGETHE